MIDQLVLFFGDAIISKRSEKEILQKYIMTEGQGASVIEFLAGGSRYPTTKDTLEKNMHRFQMQGKLVWDFAVRVMPFAVRKVIKEAGLEISDIDLLISHQANINIIKKSIDELGLPMSKTHTTIREYANTSGASEIITLADAAQKGLINKGDNVALVGFGGGLSYRAILLE